MFSVAEFFESRQFYVGICKYEMERNQSAAYVKNDVILYREKILQYGEKEELS